MKKILLICFMIWQGAIVFAQPNFAYNYSPGTAVNLTLAHTITRCMDGIIAVGRGDGIANGFLIFKTDFNGNVLWLKGFSITTTINYPVHALALQDSTIALYLYPNNVPTLDFILIKCDLSGNVLWANVYSSPQALGGIGLIQPYSNGGIVFMCTSYIAFVNSSGVVDNAYVMSDNQTVMYDIATKAPDSFTVWGIRQMQPAYYHNFLFDMNSAGNVTNSFTYALPAGDTIATYTAVPHRIISKSYSGGSYTTYNLKGNKMGAFFFNNPNQPVWGKKIEHTGYVQSRNVNACKNNGCIISASIAPSPYFLPLVMKFDSTGFWEWTKTPGDVSDPEWRNFEIRDMVQDTGYGWYSTLSTYDNIPIIHTDSAFNGFCHYENYLPTVTTIALTPTVATISFSPITFTSTVLDIEVVPQSLDHYNACTDELINSYYTLVTEIIASNNSAKVYPNPASQTIKIAFSSPLQHPMAGVITNTIGQTVVRVTVDEGVKEKEVNVNNLSSGLYYLTMNGVDGKFVTKILKQ